MKSNKKKFAIKNFIITLLAQVIILLLSFLVPRIIIVSFGSEINGLVSSINQMLGYLTLLEGGVSIAMIQALYKPIIEEDRAKISSIVCTTKKYFHKMGIIYRRVRK